MDNDEKKRIKVLAGIMVGALIAISIVFIVWAIKNDVPMLPRVFR